MHRHLLSFAVAVALLLSAAPTSAALFRKVGTGLPAMRSDSAVVAHRGIAYVVGGDSSTTSFASVDGGVGFDSFQTDLARTGGRAVAFQLPQHTVPSIVVSGGTTTANAVSYSIDGSTNWSSLPSGQFTARSGHGFVAARSRWSSAMALYVFGGRDSAGQPTNDVRSWTAGSGANWTTIVSNGASTSFSKRHNFAFATVADDSRVVVIGGACESGYCVDSNAAFISGVGLLQWTSLPAPKFGPRVGHSMVNNNGILYLVGGFNRAFLNDVWVSTDTAQSWLQLTAAAEFSPRQFLGLLILGNELLVLGGQRSDGTPDNEVWAMPL